MIYLELLDISKADIIFNAFLIKIEKMARSMAQSILLSIAILGIISVHTQARYILVEMSAKEGNP